MTNFSTNQVMQFYVASTAVGGVNILPYKDEKAFKISFPMYDNITSDKIENVEWATYTPYTKLQPKAKKMTISFAGDVVIGEDYAVKVSYPEVGGAGIESWTTKTAVAHAGKGATKETVVAELKKQLAKILGVDGVLKVEDATDGVAITANVADLKYERGVRPIVIPDFNVTVNQITDEGELTNWATLDENQQLPVESVDTGLASGYKLADMEYFAMGERGDEYRMTAYPNHINYAYKIGEKQNYSVYNIHYSYKGFNDQSHKSEKDLIIAVPGTDRLSKLEDKLTELGVSVVTVPTEE